MGTPNLISVGTTLQDLRRAVQKLASLRLNADSTATFGSMALANLTASRLVSSDADKKLVSSDLYSWVTETANQVLVADDGDGTITLSAPQDIHTGASPTFAGGTFTGLTASVMVGTTAGKALVSIPVIGSGLTLSGGNLYWSWLGMDDLSESPAEDSMMVWNGPSAGVLWEEGATLRTTLGVGTGDSPTFANLSLGTGELTCGSINRAADSLTIEIDGVAQITISSTAVTFAGDVNITGDAVYTGGMVPAADDTYDIGLVEESEPEYSVEIEQTSDNSSSTITTTNYKGATFTTSDAFTIGKMALHLYRSVGGGGTMTAHLSETTDGVPTGEDLTSVTVNCATAIPLETTWTWVEFVFDTPYDLSGTTKYAIWMTVDATASGKITQKFYNGTLLADSEYLQNAGAGWQNISSLEGTFKVYSAGETEYTYTRWQDLYLSGVARIGSLLIEDDSWIGSVTTNQAIQITAVGNILISESLAVTGDLAVTGNIALMVDNGSVGYTDNSPMIVFDNTNDHVEVVGSAGLAFTDATAGQITMDTADGSDGAVLQFCGGGVVSNTRGGYCNIFGNEHISTPGCVEFVAGYVVGGIIKFFTGNNLERFRIDENGLTTLYGNLVIPDDGYIGSASNTTAIQIASTGAVTFTNAITASNYTAANLLTACATNAGALDFSAASKTLTVEDDAIVSQDYSSDASPQFNGIELGDISDTTLSRASTGDVNIEGNIIYRAGGTDVPIADGGTGASTAQAAIDALSAVGVATNEYVLTKDTGTGNAIWKVAAGGGALDDLTDVTITSVANDEILGYSGGWINRTLAEAGIQAHGDVLDDLNTLGANASDGEFLVGTGAGALAWESGATARTSIGLAIGTDVQAWDAVLDDFNILGAAASDGQFIVATGAGVFAYESGDTARISLGVGTTDSPTFTNLSLGTGELTCGSINRAADTLTLEIAGTPEVSITATTTTFAGAISATNYTAANLLTACATNAGALDFSAASKTLTVAETETTTNYHTDARAATWLSANHETTYTHTDIALNTTHRGSNGSDHSYLDQAVTMASSPTFAGVTIADGGTIGQAAGPLLTFDDTNKYLEITGCSVGIGTAVPQRILHVVGSDFIRFDRGDSFGPAFLLVRDTGTVQSSWLFGPTNVAGATGDDFTIVDYGTAISGTSGNVRLLIDKTTGNVGIGTNSPDTLLHLKGSAAELRFEENTAGDLVDFRSSSTGAFILEQNYDADAAGNIYIRPTLTGHTYTKNLIICDMGGGVTIGAGVGAPKTRLTVVGAITLKEQAAADASTTAYGQLWIKDDDPNILMFTDDAGSDFTVNVTAV